MRISVLAGFGVASLAVLGCAAPPVSNSSPVKDVVGEAQGVEAPGSAAAWLVDAEGREYSVLEVPRVEGQYMFLNAEKTRVRLQYGVPFELAGFTDRVFLVKVYRESPEASAPPAKPEAPKAVAVTEPKARSGDSLRFLPFDQGLPARGQQWRQGFEVADLDRDGHLDILHGPPRKGRGRPIVFRGNGRGTWERWAATVFPDVGLDYGDVAVGDLNGDGWLDLVVASHLRGVLAMVGDGRGRFTSWSDGMEFVRPGSGETSSPFSSRAVRLVDWNRDGRLDVVARGEGPRMALGGPEEAAFRLGSLGFRIYLNGGDGSWRPLLGPVSRGDFGDAVAVADLNGDGLLDLLGGSQARGAKGILAWGTADGSWRPEPVAALRDEVTVYSIAAADLDADGRPEVLVGHAAREPGGWNSGVDLLRWRAEGWSRETVFNEPGRNGVTALATGDFDGNGVQDLAAGTGEGSILVFLGDGGGRFHRERESSLENYSPGCRVYALETADLDGDGRQDLLAASAGESSTRMGIPELEAEIEGQNCETWGSLRAWVARPL